MSGVECPSCDDIFDTSRGMKIHHQMVHNKRADESEYTENCPSCEKYFKTERGLEQHHAKVHNKKIGGTKVDCDNCGDTVRRKPSSIKRYKNFFCSTGCKSEYEKSERLEKECDNCESEFTTPPWEDAIYCSENCARGTKSLNCKYCEDDYEVGRAADSTFCSKECQHNWQRENWTGEDGPNWSGGWKKYYGAGWQEFRRKTRKRYNHTCQCCGKSCKEKHHDVHHIEPVREFDNVEDAHFDDNVTLLCQKCHRIVETKMDRDTQFELLRCDGEPDSWERVQELMQDV